MTVLTTRSSRAVRVPGGCDRFEVDRAPIQSAFPAASSQSGGGAPPLSRLPVQAARGGKKAPGDGAGSGTAVITRTRTQTQRPSMYRVLLLNDDYTPMEFVVGVLCTFFHKTLEDAERIMWQVHTNGVGECGVYTYEVADTKVTQVMDHARKHQHPLQCVMEKK
ncbi:ATP-dependent Clp protease adapter protein ClpS [Rhodoblastus acidophilus]|uniref:ATP-dependent Clp protease adapter protein ClpS n=1 Tax=Rhodoblastus acidophilus TaxID=1074 RepID=A0A212RI68_RHOAC|nr:ATP-dependent Clp protease adaptor protein ClpS [Rhodoblastus acidophilus]SNB71962.1 ATP-dependent Clp protease adapter protein ClpS [Rhodoblastus acidophilus]